MDKRLFRKKIRIEKGKPKDHNRMRMRPKEGASNKSWHWASVNGGDKGG